MSKLRKFRDYNLRENYAGRSETGEVYLNQKSNNLRLWLRFSPSGIEELSKFEDVTTSYEGSPEFEE